MAKEVEKDTGVLKAGDPTPTGPDAARAERLARVAEAVRRGTYRVDSAEVADRLVETMLGRRTSSTN